jgi:hypothetical protein
VLLLPPWVPADQQEFAFLRLPPGSTMVVDRELGEYDGRNLWPPGVRLVRR